MSRQNADAICADIARLFTITGNKEPNCRVLLFYALLLKSLVLPSKRINVQSMYKLSTANHFEKDFFFIIKFKSLCDIMDLMGN